MPPSVGIQIRDPRKPTFLYKGYFALLLQTLPPSPCMYVLYKVYQAISQ